MGVDRTSITEPVIIGANSRRKASFKIGGSGNKIKFGFYNNQSHQIANIDYCMVLEPAINELIPHLKQLILNLTIKISEISILNSDSGIDLLFYSNEEPTLKQGQQIVEFAKKFNISRVSIDIKGAIYSVIKFTSIQLHIGDARIDLPEKCFIQASRQSQQYITNMIIKHIGNSKKIIDLYAGCGTYSFALAKTAKIHAVEGASDMVKAIEKTGIITAEKRDLHNNPVTAKELSKYQAVVINPPRNGASRQISEIASSNINKVIMVSCNPQTFASDAKILLGSGFKLTIATAIDQFYFSNHLEICSFFTRGGA
jgi:23S rRNA (uracil1939-C5)-methyltransferase